MKFTRKHSLPLRVFHWVNVPVLVLLIWSGILIYWAHQAYVKLPEWLVTGANLHHRLAEGMGWHFFLMWIFFINGILFLLYAFRSGHWRELLPSRQDLRQLIPFILSDLKLSRTDVSHLGKYNPAQKVAYTSAILMGAGTVITGLAIYKPVQLGWLTSVLGGYKWARFEHFFLMASLILFIAIHLAQVIRSGWKNLRSMITGYDIEKD